ncbi:MAG: amidase domain-containing protein [Chloroflexota bacterium]|nr:amidase domain-containing protein [Chloroflexota bacterium]
MRKAKFVSVFVLLALLLSAVPDVVMGQEPQPLGVDVKVIDETSVNTLIAYGSDESVDQDSVKRILQRLEHLERGWEEDKIKEVINAYFELRYKARKLLEPADFSPLVVATDVSTTADWLQREQDRQEIEHFIAETFQTSYLEYKVFLDYPSIEVNGSEAVVKLLEGNEVYYTTHPTLPSRMANLEHTITLKNVDGRWRISNDQYRGDTIELLEALDKEEILKNVQNNYDAQFIEPTIEGQTAQPESTHWYNGTAAANYADTWAYGINPIYHDESVYGDCTNFASQAIYESTNHTMSTPPGYMDKWYYDFPTHSGSYPWVNVDGLYTFLTTNSGRGPYGYSSGAYTCNLHKGDVVTMKQGGVWQHTVVVSRIVGSCHVPSNIRVDAHDEDHYQRPLSEYSGYAWYAITISGYRD